MQNNIFEQDEADAYFERNKNNNNTFIAQYLLSRIEHSQLNEYSCASFGVGSGFNFVELEKNLRIIHGFDVSEKSIINIKMLMGSKYDAKRVYVQKLNLVEPFNPPIRYDIVIYDWFAYILTNEELELVKVNLMNSIKSKGFVLIHDFIVRDYHEKTDIHDQRLNIYKRNLIFYLKYFCEFDLISFDLYDSREYMKIIEEKRVNEINVKLSANDYDWVFCAIFRLR